MRVFDRISNWIAGARSRRELARLGARDVERLARDSGVSNAELVALARQGPDAGSLLPRRLAALGLDAEELARREPQVLRDLQRVCSLCESTGRCRRELNRDPDNPAWETYCPNVTTLRALR